MNEEIKKHMDVLFREVKTWPKEMFPKDNPKTPELLFILENFDEIEEDSYEDFFEQMMDPTIFNPIVHVAVQTKNFLNGNKLKDQVASYEYMLKLFLELKGDQ